MKLAELKAGEEYAVLAPNARYRSASKVVFTKEQLERGVNSYSKKVKCMKYARVWEDRDWSWQTDEVSLSQVRELWSEYSVKAEAEKKAAEERRKRNEEHRQAAEKETALLREFLQENKKALSEALGMEVNSYTYTPVKSLDFTRAQLQALLERLNK